MRPVHIDEPLLDRAGELRPLALRSLDAIHLAAALAIGPDLAVLLTYDRRLAKAARGRGCWLIPRPEQWGGESVVLPAGQAGRFGSPPRQ